MSQELFLGLDSNAWLAVVGGIYAGATLYLAVVTNSASKRAADVTREQIRAAQRSTRDQIEAAKDAQDQQYRAVREAAIIQARASSVSNNRQAWINALREEVTGFLTDADLIPYVRDGIHIQSDLREGEFLRINRSLSEHIFKIRLLINPTEGESVTLVGMLEDAALNGLTSDRREAIVGHTQTILKTEWERVKSGD